MNKKQLVVYPILNDNTLDTLEMLDIVCNHCQSLGFGRTTYKQVVILQRLPKFLKPQFLLAEHINGFCERNNLDFLQKTIDDGQILCSLRTFISTISQFHNGDVRDVAPTLTVFFSSAQ